MLQKEPHTLPTGPACIILYCYY